MHNKRRNTSFTVFVGCFLYNCLSPTPCLGRVTLYLHGWSPLKYCPTEMIYFHLCCISAMQNEEAAPWLVALKNNKAVTCKQ